MSKVKTVLNSENITIEKARELVGNAALWPRVRDFLWDFAPQVHASWLEDAFSRRDAEPQRASNVANVEMLPIANANVANGNGPESEIGSGNTGNISRNLCVSAPLRDVKSPRVKRFILDTLGVEPCFHDFPKDDGSRLLLLDGATLLEIAKWLGALACAPELRRVTDGATVRALKAALPGVYPEVFGYTAYFDFGFGFSHAETQSAQRIEAVGYKMLFDLLADSPDALKSRFKLKFPKTLCDLCLSAPLRETKIKYPIILKLLKLKFQEAHSLCCC